MRPLALAALLLVGCSSAEESHPMSLAIEGGIDVETETSADAVADVDAGGIDAATDTGQDATTDAVIDSFADSPDTDITIDASDATYDVTLDAVNETDSAPACVPVYTVQDSNTVTADAGQAAVIVQLECAPGEKTSVGHWLGLCELDGDFATGCNCTHVGETGVKCGAITSSTGTVTLTIWCERACD